MSLIKSTSSVGLEQFNFTQVNCFDMRKFQSIFRLNSNELSLYLNFPRQQVKAILSAPYYKPRKKDHIVMLKDFQKVLTIFLLLIRPEIKKEQEKLNEIVSTWFKAPNPALPDFRSPLDLIAAGKGQVIIDLLNDEIHSTYS